MPDLLLPTRAWPARVYEHEPAHGFFKRVAMVNSQVSVRTFAEGFGLNGRNIQPQELLEFCRQLPSAGIEKLEAATPVLEDGFATIYGEKFSLTNNYSLSHPRICPACLEEQNYYRNWFDIAVVFHCPIHNLALVGNSASSALRWWHPSFGATPEGEDLTLIGRSRVKTGVSWDAYVLGRLGVTDRIEVPALDSEPIQIVTEVLELVGAHANQGWSVKPVGRLPKRDYRRAVRLSAGFDVFRSGEAGMVTFLEGYARSRPGFANQLMPSLTEFFGALRTAVQWRDDSPLKGQIWRAMDDVGLQFDVVSRKSRPPLERLKGATLTLNEAARVLGLTPSLTRNVARRLGLVSRLVGKGSRHRLSNDDIEAISAAISDSVMRASAAKQMGLTIAEFGERCRDLGIKPLARLKRATGMHDYFLPSDLEAAAAGISRLKRPPARFARSRQEGHTSA